MPKRKNNDEPSASPAKKCTGHWVLGLTETMDDPEFIVKSDELVTVIKDKYPKAEVHYLVLPKEDISSLKAVKKEHLSLLKHMEDFVKNIIKEKHADKKFKLGYHSEASMHRLHLHAISEDMNSPCLKTKKHWNSFNTDFFLHSKDVITSLEENDRVTLLTKGQCQQLMETPLKCHKCDFVPKNMPHLKKHILTHES